MKEGYDMEQLDQMRVQQEILEKQVTLKYSRSKRSMRSDPCHN